MSDRRDPVADPAQYTAQRARQGYNLNQFAMSLMKEENRTRFLADEKTYLDEWPLTDAATPADAPTAAVPIRTAAKLERIDFLSVQT